MEGNSYEGFRGLSRTTLIATFSEAGWNPRETRGERIWTRIEGLIAFTRFQVRYGMPAGSGADKEEDLESAWAISSFVRGGVELCGLSLGGGEKGALGAKKWLNRALFICCGVSAPWREGKRGAAQPEANHFAVHKFWGVVESSKEDQCLFLRA